MFDDAHPALGDWAQRAAAEAEGAGSEPAAPCRRRATVRPGERPAAAPRAVPSMALTPKEREVLELLARNLSNKEIGLAMQVGEETDQVAHEEPVRQARRRHAQAGGARARILGLLEEAG